MDSVAKRVQVTSDLTCLVESLLPLLRLQLEALLATIATMIPAPNELIYIYIYVLFGNQCNGAQKRSDDLGSIPHTIGPHLLSKFAVILVHTHLHERLALPLAGSHAL